MSATVVDCGTCGLPLVGGEACPRCAGPKCATCGRLVSAGTWECWECQGARRSRTGGAMGRRPGTMAYARRDWRKR